jgi:Lrp/AsnC family leucine-responsive transcriptional regulator
MNKQLDATDLRILQILDSEGQVSKAEIGRRINLASSAVFERLRRLEENGIVRGYRVDIDYAKLGFPILAFVFITETKPTPAGETLASLSSLGIAQEAHRILGDDCFALKIRCKDTDDLRDKLDQIGSIRTIAAVRTHIALQSIESRTSLLSAMEIHDSGSNSE